MLVVTTNVAGITDLPLCLALPLLSLQQVSFQAALFDMYRCHRGQEIP